MMRIVLIAHDTKKNDMIEWLRSRRKELSLAELFATRPTGKDIVSKTGMQVSLLPAGQDAADEMVRRMVEEGLVDLVTFLWNHRTVFTPEEIRRLGATVEALTVKSGNGFESLISSMSGEDFSTFHLLPVFHKDVLTGVLAPGYGNGQGREKEDLIRGRRIVDQVGVALARTVDAKSPWTAGHSERVTNLSVKIGKAMGLPAEELELLHRAGLLHDIGKIAVPGAILDKPASLTDAEYACIKLHPEKGALILEPIPAYREVVPIVAQHHEWFDGTGYPRGLAGEAISPGARIVAVADVFESLTSKRPYRSELSADFAMGHIVKLAGRQFDPVVVQVFRRIDLRGDPSTVLRDSAPGPANSVESFV